MYLTPGAASSNRATSSGLKTAGISRGSRTNVRCCAISGRSSVTVKKRRNAATEPLNSYKAASGRSIAWKLPIYNTLLNILTNPVYAGAYAFGRTTSKVIIEDGRKRVRRGLRRPLTEWDVLLKDQHEGYIAWDEFERNQSVIADNATGKGSAIARGAARGGELLLTGLVRCGHCGRKMYAA